MAWCHLCVFRSMWTIANPGFSEGANVIPPFPSPPISLSFPFPSLPTMHPLCPFFFYALILIHSYPLLSLRSLPRSPGVWGRAPVNGVRWHYLAKLLKFTLRFGSFWCILATNLRLPNLCISLSVCVKFLLQRRVEARP